MQVGTAYSESPDDGFTETVQRRRRREAGHQGESLRGQGIRAFAKSFAMARSYCAGQASSDPRGRRQVAGAPLAFRPSSRTVEVAGRSLGTATRQSHKSVRRNKSLAPYPSRTEDEHASPTARIGEPVPERSPCVTGRGGATRVRPLLPRPGRRQFTNLAASSADSAAPRVAPASWTDWSSSWCCTVSPTARTGC